MWGCCRYQKRPEEMQCEVYIEEVSEYSQMMLELLNELNVALNINIKKKKTETDFNICDVEELEIVHHFPTHHEFDDDVIDHPLGETSSNPKIEC